MERRSIDKPLLCSFSSRSSDQEHTRAGVTKQRARRCTRVHSRMQLLAAHSFVAANLWGSRANGSSHRAASSSVPAGIVGGGESRELDLAIKLASSLKSNEGTAGYVGYSRSLARVFPRRVLWGVIKSETEERGIRRTRAVKGGAERACTVPIEMCDALVD